MTNLKPGDKAPDFEAQIQSGKTVKLEDYKGKKLAMFFYPHDLTPTCTVEACNLKDNYKALKKQGIEVLGVSEDDLKKHNKFIDKHSLPFDLLSDPELKVLKAYGVWGPKKFMGREFDGTHRTTFLIDEEGIIIDVITKVKSKIHADQILEVLVEQ